MLMADMVGFTVHRDINRESTHSQRHANAHKASVKDSLPTESLQTDFPRFPPRQMADGNLEVSDILSMC